MLPLSDWCAALNQDGCLLLPAVFAPDEVAAMRSALQQALGGEGVLRDAGGEGTVYAARNVLSLWPASAKVWHRSPLVDAVRVALGPGCGLVRVLYFDKPPGQSWALPWHKDLTIAVRDNRLPSSLFRAPTKKAGVPHVEAPLAVLETMLTARIHLDEITDENGPLKVIPGSHRTGKDLALDAPPHVILSRAGDVLLMRPLLAHCSGRSVPTTARHRRILHLELASSPSLPDGYAWHDFVPGP
jgi:hypothetical protein